MEYSPRRKSGEDSFLYRTDSDHEHNSNEGNRSLPLCSSSSEPNTSYDSDDDHLLPLSPAVRRGGETPFREREFPQLCTTRRRVGLPVLARTPGFVSRAYGWWSRPTRLYTQAKLQFTHHPQLVSTPMHLHTTRPRAGPSLRPTASPDPKPSPSLSPSPTHPPTTSTNSSHSL